MPSVFRWMIAVLVTAVSLPLVAAELTGEAKDAQGKIQAKGGLVIPVAANSDAWAVSLANAGKNATDAEVALVKSLPKVEQLDLRGTGVTDKGLAAIEGLTSLTQLHLENTAVTDDGLTHLKGLTKLEYLNLYNTAVTDKGIEQLNGLKNLKKLYLWQSKVTDAGVASLKKSLPEVYVNRGESLAIATQPAPAAPAMEKKPDAKPAEKKPAEKKPAEKKPEAKPAEKVATAAATEVKPAPAGSKAINTKCPLSGEDVDADHLVLFDGKVIGLCCEKCQAKFTADPKKFIAKVTADAK